MGQRVMRPRFVVAQFHRLPRGSLGFVEQVTLLIAKGDHAVGVGDVFGLGQGFERHAQHSRRIAVVEKVVLRQFQDRQIARPLIGDPVAGGQEGRHIAVHPITHGADHLLFTGIRALGRLRALQIGAGFLRGDGVFKKHPQERGIGIHQRAFRIGIRCRDNQGGLGLVREKAVDEVIDSLHGIRAAGRGVQSVKVLCHLRSPASCRESGADGRRRFRRRPSGWNGQRRTG